MSGLLFPSALPGVQIDVHREPVDDVDVEPSLGGKETRFTESTYQRIRYTLNLELLRTYGSFREFQQLVTHFTRHRGRLDSFLVTDVEDSSVTDMGFAVGDGSTASFQLQRTLGGDVIDAAGFTYKAQSKPYVNMVKNSSFETDTNADGTADSWASYNNESATVPQFLTIVPGVNGGNAQRVSWGTNSASQHGITTGGAGGAPAWLAGQWYTVSFLARASGTNVGQFIGFGFDAPNPNQLLVISDPALTGAWQRYVFQFFWNLGTVPVTNLYLTVTNSQSGAAGASGTFGDVDFDEIFLVAGQFTAATLPQPNITPAATTGTDNPAYWPSRGDGFEPIFDLAASPTIYQDGDWQGRRQLYPYTRSNFLPFSEQFSNAAWIKSGTLTAVADTTAAPDGTTTADTINEGAGNDAKNISQNTSPAEVQGELRCYSVFVKANNLPNISFRISTSNFGINFNLGTGVIDSTNGALEASGVITSPLWPGWYRIWFVKRVTATLGTGARLLSCLDNTYSAAAYLGTSRTFFAWGAMAERTSNLLGPTPYIKTPSSAAVTVTDYTLTSLGVVTPATVLPAGAFLSWDGSYYRRVRHENDNLPADRIVSQMWQAKSVSLISVKV